MAKGTAGSQKLPQDLLSHPMWSALRKRHVLRITFLITLGTICAFVWGGGLLHHFSQSQGGVLSCAGLLRQALGQAGLPPSLGGESFPGFPGIRGFNQTEGMRPMKELGESIIPALFATERYAEKRAQYPGHQFLIRRPIPVVGIPVLNNGHWLKRLVYSIDVPVRKIQLIVGTLPDTDVIDASVEEAIEELNHRLPPGFLAVKRYNCNLGVSGGWNAVWEHNLDAAWYLMVSADVAFAPGALARVPDELEDPQNKDILVFTYSMFRFWAIRREALDVIGVYDENLWPFTFDDNEYTARMERVQALTPDVQRIAWIGRPLPNGEIFKEIAHMHGTAEKMGPFAEIWAEPERNAKGESVSGTLRADPRYDVRRDRSALNVLRYMMNKWNFTYWPMHKAEDQLRLSWLEAFDNPERGIPRWTLDPMYRAIQMTLWNFDNDLEKDIIWKRYNFANMLPGDVRAQPEREWHDRKGNELQVVLPKGVDFNTEALIKSQGPQCVTGFARAQGLVSKLLELQKQV